MKWVVMLAMAAVSIFFLYPSINWYFQLDAKERGRLESARMRPRWLLNLGLDLKGGTHLVMELDVEKLPANADVADALNRAIETIRNRIDQFGVAEPLIAREGDRWIVVQLPGITNSEQAKDLVGKTALLEFRMVESSESAQRAAQKIAELGDPFEAERKPEAEGKTNFDTSKPIKSAAKKLLPPGTTIMPGKEANWYIVSDKAALTGAFLETAGVEMGGNYGLPVVNFKFNAEGGQRFGALTGANVGKELAIVLDGVVYSAPRINSRITNSGIIEGRFSTEEARKLAIVLRSGALPAPVRIIEERTVGPTLGEDSIKTGVRASLVGLGFVVLFMIAYYRLSGFFAVCGLLANLLFLLAGMSYFNATLTLPGIAGIILALAMGIDANVIIFERIREEINIGKPVRLAVETGYDKAWYAIIDAHVAELISAVFLFQFGTGPIRGFALTLSMGILISIVTAIYITHWVFESWLAGGAVEELSI